jgi:hypothetical protein
MYVVLESMYVPEWIAYYNDASFFNSIGPENLQ